MSRYGLEIDLWAIGVINYILLCGFPPFRSKNKNQEELFSLIMSGEFQFVSPYWDKVSKGAKVSYCLTIIKYQHSYYSNIVPAQVSGSAS